MTETAPPSLWNSLLGAEVVVRQLPGGATRCLEAGDGPPLVLLHGTGGHAEAWARNLTVLASRYRVVAPDFFGHGLSTKPADLQYVISDYTQQVRDLLADLGVASASFVGLSLGGWVASWLALESPDVVDTVVNCGGAAFRWRDGQQAGESSDRKAWQKANNALSALSRDSVRARLHTLFHDSSSCTEELVDLRLALYSSPGAAEVLPLLHRMIPYDSPQRVRFSLTPDVLQSLSVPVLYLWGEHNTGGSVDGAARAASLTPHGELQVIPGAGHWPQWERPADFNRAVLDFLDRTTPAQRAWETAGAH